MSRKFKSPWWFIFDITIGGVALWYSTKLFLFGWFCYLTWVLYTNHNGIRALVRVYQISNEVALLAIRNKLGVGDTELQESREEYFGNLTSDERASVDRDFKAVA